MIFQSNWSFDFFETSYLFHHQENRHISDSLCDLSIYLYGCASMYGCFGALHPCSANMLRMLRCHVLRYQAVWSPPLFTACVSVTCVARACSWGWATHGLLIVISTGVPWCPAGTHPCAPDAQAVWHRSQSANSCCAELCCVVVSGGCVVHVVVWIVSSLRFVMCPLTPLLDMVTAVALSILRDTSHHSWTHLTRWHDWSPTVNAATASADQQLWFSLLLLHTSQSDLWHCTSLLRIRGSSMLPSTTGFPALGLLYGRRAWYQS